MSDEPIDYLKLARQAAFDEQRQTVHRCGGGVIACLSFLRCGCEAASDCRADRTPAHR